MPSTDDKLFINLTEDEGVKKQKLVEGSGEPPKNGMSVTVHYTGTLKDGTKFDSSRDKDKPFVFTLGQGSVIKGWDIAVKTMKVGEKSNIICSPPYAYGPEGKGDTIPANSTLHFEIELLSFDFEDITGDGFITKEEIKKGEDNYKTPNDESTCQLKISGKILNSKIFFLPECEKTIIIGEDESFPSGFNTAVKKMHKNERSRFYIKPSEHHFNDFSMPKNVKKEDTLVYDIELKSFENQKEIWDMNIEEKLSFALKSKLKGNEYFKKKRFDDASKYYEKTISYLENFSEANEEEKKEMNKLRIAAWNNLSILYMKKEDYNESLEKLNKVLEVDSDNLKALYHRAISYMNLGEYELAKEDIKKVIIQEPNKKYYRNIWDTIYKKENEANKRFKGMCERMFPRV